MDPRQLLQDDRHNSAPRLINFFVSSSVIHSAHEKQNIRQHMFKKRVHLQYNKSATRPITSLCLTIWGTILLYIDIYLRAILSTSTFYIYKCKCKSLWFLPLTRLDNKETSHRREVSLFLIYGFTTGQANSNDISHRRVVSLSLVYGFTTYQTIDSMHRQLPRT